MHISIKDEPVSLTEGSGLAIIAINLHMLVENDHTLHVRRVHHTRQQFTLRPLYIESKDIVKHIVQRDFLLIRHMIRQLGLAQREGGRSH